MERGNEQQGDIAGGGRVRCGNGEFDFQKRPFETVGWSKEDILVSDCC